METMTSPCPCAPGTGTLRLEMVIEDLPRQSGNKISSQTERRHWNSSAPRALRRKHSVPAGCPFLRRALDGGSKLLRASNGPATSGGRRNFQTSQESFLSGATVPVDESERAEQATKRSEAMGFEVGTWIRKPSMPQLHIVSNSRLKLVNFCENLRRVERPLRPASSRIIQIFSDKVHVLEQAGVVTVMILIVKTLGSRQAVDAHQAGLRTYDIRYGRYGQQHEQDYTNKYTSK